MFTRHYKVKIYHIRDSINSQDKQKNLLNFMQAYKMREIM